MATLLIVLVVVVVSAPKVLKLFGMQVVIITKREVPIKQLHGWHRVDFTKMCQYAAQPRETYPRITCRKHAFGYLILDGHHRWKAAMRRGDTTVRIQYF